MLDINRFDYETYDDLLKRLTATHGNLRFGDVDSNRHVERYFILRHDVDHSPAKALKMAEIESRAGVRATYFLLLNSHFYNLLSPAHTGFARCLVELGHEVGLHYDLAVLEQYGKSKPIAEILLQFTRMLETLAGAPVKSLSMHAPSYYNRLDPFIHLDGFVNAYAPRFTQEIEYFSDSCGAWRNEAYMALTRGPLPPRMQILIHPIFWGADKGDRWQRLHEFMEYQQGILKQHYERVKSIWPTHAGVMEHEQRVASK